MRSGAGCYKVFAQSTAGRCHYERSEAISIELWTVMEIAAPALGLDPGVASLLAMTASDHMEQIQQNDNRDRDANSPE